MFNDCNDCWNYFIKILSDINYSSNIPKIYLIRFFGMFLIIMPVLVPFFLSFGLSMKDVYIVQAVFACTVFVCEIPSGYISDIFGRRKTLIVSFFLRGIGFSLFPFADNFTVLMIAEVILGVAISLSSGTDISLLYDSMEPDEKNPQKILGKSISFLPFGEGLAALLTTLLIYFSVSLIDISILSAVAAWLPFAIALSLKEPSRKKMSGTHKENFSYIFKKIFYETKILRLIVFNSMLYFCATLIAVWSFQKYWESFGVELIYFGFLWAFINLFVSFIGVKADWLEKKWGSEKSLILMGVLPIAGYLGFYFSTEFFLCFFSCLLFQVCRGLGQVILKNALNARVSSDFRASANSVAQMGVRVCFIILGPLYGYGIDAFGQAQASLVMAFFYGFIFLIFMKPLVQEVSLSKV